MNIDPSDAIAKGYEQSYVVGLLVTLSALLFLVIRFLFLEWKKIIERQQEVQLQTNTVVQNNTTTSEKLLLVLAIVVLSVNVVTAIFGKKRKK